MPSIIQNPSSFWLLLAVFFVLGTLFGWWIRTMMRNNASQNEFNIPDQERQHLAAVNTQLRQSIDLREADLKKTRLELEQLQAQAAQLEEEKSLHLSAVQSAAARLRNAHTEAESQAARLLAYEEQVLGLRTRNATLIAENNRHIEEINAYKSLHMDFTQMHRNMEALEEAVAQIEHERNLAQQELSAAHIEIENLQAAVLAAPHAANGHGLENARIQYDGSNGASNGSPTINGFHHLIEDLKVINGISPFAEVKLHEMGVHTIEQISQWDEHAVAMMNEVLGFFPGRIQKENWVGQAQHLVTVSQEV